MSDFSALVDRPGLAQILGRRGYEADVLVDARLDQWVLETLAKLLDQLVQDGAIRENDPTRAVVQGLLVVPR